MALKSLPAHFSSNLDITGVSATDLFNFHSALGATIEDQVVEALNGMRAVWDPDNQYQTFRFVRQPQTFPDVRLQREVTTDPTNILLGIELKGWFALSKEGEPSFRYVITPNACAEADLLVVAPWIFKNVISGKPKLLPVFIEEARYAAQLRNYHWQYERGDGSDAAGVLLSAHRTPYPAKKDKSSDKAKNDSGGNFGRIARTGVMKAFVESAMKEPVAGIPISAWQRFLKVFSETVDAEKIERVLTQVGKEISDAGEISADARHEIAEYFDLISRHLRTK